MKKRYKVCSNCEYYYISMCDDVVCTKWDTYITDQKANECEYFEFTKGGE